MIVGKKRRFSSLEWLYVSLSLFTILLVVICPTSDAADYPNRPIQMIIPFPPGGGADTMARIFVNKLADILGQPVAIVNKPGGGGIIGAYAAATAPPDGYTMSVLGPPMILGPLLTKGIKVDLFRDFIPINLPGESPTIIAVKKDAPWATLEELIADANKNPGKLTGSTSGPSGTPRFALELFKFHTRTQITHVPMDGTAPAVMAVLGGHTSFALPEVGVVIKYLEAGSLRPLVVMSENRVKIIANTPTMGEKGYPKIISASWNSITVPAKTSPEIVGKLEKAFKQVMEDKEIIERFEKIGYVVLNLNSRETADFYTKTQQSMSEVAKAAGIEPQ